MSRVDYLVLSDTHVHQGKFIDQLALADFGQFGMGNRLDNYIYDGSWRSGYGFNTLVGNTGRDSIIANNGLNVLIGGTAYGTDNVGSAIADFAGVEIGGNGLTNSIFRDTDPVPVPPNGPAVADPSQFWFVPGYYGDVYDPNRNQDTLAASDESEFANGLTLDGGAGRDSLVGTDTALDRTGDMFIVSQGFGGRVSQSIVAGDAVIGNGGNDTVTFTDSDYLWWSGHQEGALLQKNSYTLGEDISNLILGQGAVSARDGVGNRTSTGYKDAVGSNLIIGNEFANILDGAGVGGQNQTGSGIDTLTGGSGDDLFVVSGYTASTGNKWDVSAEKIEKEDDPNNGKFELDLAESTFTDSDYVFISDFESSDSIRISGDLSQYWIGAAPSKSGLAEDNVRPGSAGLTEFGIYRAPTGLKDGPNLVAHIRLKGWSLDPADLSSENYAFTPNLGPISDTDLYLGWGEFYRLSGSSFASSVDQGQYIQKDSYASLVQIFLAGDNTFQGGSSNDTFNGYDGNDTLKGGAGNDTLIGGEGQDSLLGEAGADSLLGEAGFDTILGGDDNDTLDGGAGSDSLLGEAGDDSLFGGSGNDFLDGGLGVNSLQGGDGNDTLVWSAQNATMDGGAGINALLFNSGATLDDTGFGVISNISKIALSDAADLVTLGTSAVTKGFTSINSNGGNDTLNASAIDADVTLSGGAGADSILGGSGTDSLVGGADNDTLFGGGNGDTLLGEAGADSLLGGAGADSLLGGADNDTLLGEAGSDTLLGEAGADSLLGGAGNDSLLGGADNDTLLGEAGSDTLFGEAGSNSLLGGADNDSLVAGTGTDTILGEAGNDTLVADSIGSASMLGGNDNDSFLFSNGIQLTNNTVDGGSGIDTLVFTAAATLGDTQIAKISSVEVIQLSSLEGNALALSTRAQAAGISSIFGGISSDLISVSGMSGVWVQGNYGGTSTLSDTLVLDQGTNKSTLVGNDSLDAINYFSVTYASLLGNNTITGGVSSTDYIQLTEFADIITDSSFSHLSGINKLIYSYGSNFFTLGEQAAAAFDGDTIFLELGVYSFSTDTIDLSGVTSKKVYIDATNEYAGSIITAGAFENTLIGGLYGDDLFIFNKGAHLQQANIVGGGGTDTLRINANAQIIDSDALSGVKSIEVLDIVGAGNKITLGDIPTVIATIVGGSGPNTIDAGTYISPSYLTWNMNASSGSDSLLGGKDGNLFQIKNGANLQNSFINGDTGNDTIQLLAGAQTLGDSAFGNISAIDKLVLGSATNGNSITLGTTAASKGIATVIGGTSRDTIDAGVFGKGIWIDASAGTGSRLIGSTVAPLGNTLIGATAGGNEFVVGELGKNSIVGGSNARDILTFNSATTISDLVKNDQISDGSTASISKIGILKFNAAGNNIVLGQDALIAGIRTLVGGEGNDTGGDSYDTSRYGTVGVLFQITDQNYLTNITTMVGGSGVDTLKFSRDGVSVTDENVANLKNIDVLRTANGNNHFLIHDDFVAAGIDSIIGGTGRDTINMSDNTIYTPASVADMITMDMSAGSGYTLVSSTRDLPANAGNFRFAKVIGGLTAGSVILDGTSLADIDFEHMYQANIGSLFMRVGSNNTVVLGENARGSGLDTLTMSAGDDVIDVTDFLSALAVNGGAGNDVVDTSFAALANLTFNGNDGVDTLRLVGAEARSITSLAGSYEAFALEAGNNFVVLANDAGLSTIFGGSGNDTISMLSNTTGINFVMDATRLGNSSGFASLDGGSGSDTLTVHSVAASFLDSQFARAGSVFWPGDIGAIENFETEVGANQTYTFGTTAYLSGIQNVYAFGGDVLNAGGFSDGDAGTTDDRALNFVFVTEADAAAATVTGTGAVGNDTLTLTTDAQAVTDATFANKTSMETLVLANGANSVILSSNAQTAGLEVVIGGSGNDALTFNTTLQTSLVFNGGAQTTFDSATISNSGVTLTDAYFDDWASVERLTTANGNNNIALGANAVAGGIATVTGGTDNDTFNASAYTTATTLIGNGGNDSLLSGTGNDSLSGGNGTDWLQATSSTAAGGNQIDTLTGGAGNDTLILGDASNCYYNTAIAGGDYALITDFSTGDKLQLKTLDAAAAGNGYVVGNAIYGVLGASNYYLYRDANNNGTVEDGDNLVAGINSSVALTTANLKSTHGSFV